MSSTDGYASGRFDEALKSVLRTYDAIMDMMLPTLGKERRQDLFAGAADQPGERQGAAGAGRGAWTPKPGWSPSRTRARRIEQSILGGGAKLQWKVDWAMRWVALGVDYEMSGKDLIDSVTQSSKIARALGGRPPEGFNYEMFLDEKGEKISKTKGNGLSLEQWLTLCARGEPRLLHLSRAEKGEAAPLSRHPRAVDEYYQFRANYPASRSRSKLGNPVHHVHAGRGARRRACR